jgi:Ca-activated chloride channel family protein
MNWSLAMNINPNRSLKWRRMLVALFAIAIISLLALSRFPTENLAQTQSGKDEEQATNVDKTLSPYFFVQGDPSVDQLPLKSTNVEIAVSGVIADVKVLQTYRNEGSRPINATYVFPASTRSAVYGMRMRIGDNLIIAKIKEREKAKEEFETAKKEGKSASLLEQQRPNVFSMNLANLMPRDEVEIELRYTELLVPTDGVYEMVYPTVVGPRYSSESAARAPASDRFVESPYLHHGKKPTSELHISSRIAAGVPVQELACTSHQIIPQWLSTGVAQVTLDDSDPFQGNKDFVLRYRLAGNQIMSGVLLYQGQDENFFLYMAQPPQRPATDEIPRREYIFVVDVSGSMDGFPLDTSKQLLRNLIGRLRPTDLFNVVLFAGDAALLAPESLEANPDNIRRAINLIEQQRGNGGTELLPAIQQAMSIPREANFSRSVVLVTDGYISGEEGVFKYVRENLNKCNVFAFGIGTGVNRYLIEGVAKAGMGEPFIVSDPAEAPAVAERFREYIQTPLLTDVQVRAVGFETYDVSPVQLPDLLAQRPIIVFGKWRGSPTGTFELTGKSGHGAYHSSFDVSQVQPDESNRALRYLWARSRIADLSDYGFGEPSDDAVKEITALGLKYNLLTQYTSFVAVLEKIRNTNGGADNVDQPLPLPVGVSDLAVGSEPELIWLIVVAALLGLTMIVGKRWRRRLTGALDA